MRAAHTSQLSHAMEVRPNSHPERTGRHMTGTLSDGTVVDAAIETLPWGVLSVPTQTVKVTLNASLPDVRDASQTPEKI